MYHRHEDGSVLRLEARLSGTWHDLTCDDVVEANIQWGDTNGGDDLTPYSDAGQASITLKDLDGRYGPLPPSGSPLFTRWCPVRIWVGYVSDPDDMPVDTTTRYGLPGEYGSTPPETYGGAARTAHADGISCRFSGWLMSQERTPEAVEAVTTWTCGDGMVRLVDQDVRDYDTSLTPGAPVTNADWPVGLRENAPGNMRVGTLVSFIHGPSGEPYGVVSGGAPTGPMMQSPGGKVGNLVHKVAEADLSFFWWQPDVWSPADPRHPGRLVRLPDVRLVGAARPGVARPVRRHPRLRRHAGLRRPELLLGRAGLEGHHQAHYLVPPTTMVGLRVRLGGGQGHRLGQHQGPAR